MAQRQEVIKARDEEIYTFILNGGSYHQAADRWNMKVQNVHRIVRGVAQTTRMARQETALDSMLENLDEVMKECLMIGTSSSLQAYIRAQDQQAKLLGLYGREERMEKAKADDEFSAWDYVESEEA